MAEANRLPWYSFLYRLLGAQATFYLWLAAIITLWWTAKPAVVRFANRHPKPLTVAEARSPSGLVRWVKLHGVELELDRGLLQREERAQNPPARLLLAGEDPAAQWWLETRRLCALAAKGGPQDPAATKARLALIERRTQLAGEGRRVALPAPERSILLQDLSVTETRLPLAVRRRSGGGIEDFEKALGAWIELVQARVRPDVTLEGVLDEAPPTVIGRVKDEVEVVPASYLLQLDRQPRETESIVFAGAALVLLFLAAGLWGASQSASEAAGASAETPAPEAPPVGPDPAAEPVPSGDKDAS